MTSSHIQPFPCRSPMQSRDSKVLESSLLISECSSLPPVRPGLTGMSETVEELMDLFKDTQSPIQLAVLIGPPGIGCFSRSATIPLLMSNPYLLIFLPTSKANPCSMMHWL